MQSAYNKNAICRNSFIASTNAYCIFLYTILHFSCHVAARGWMYVVTLKLVVVLVHLYIYIYVYIGVHYNDNPNLCDNPITKSPPHIFKICGLDLI